MFIEFQVANFKSFRDLQTFSMVAAPARSGEPGMEEAAVFEAGGLRLLKSKAIFGANASGKSNLALAMSSFALMVRDSVREEKTTREIWIDRFGLLHDWDAEPIFFQFQFLHEEKIYRYGFTIKAGVVESEWLFGRPNKQEVKFFVRGPEGMDINDTYFKGAKAFVELSKNGEHEIFRPDSLFLTGAALLGNGIAVAVRKTIQQLMTIDGLKDSENTQSSMTLLSDGNPIVQATLRDIMRAADPSIKDLKMMEVSAEEIAGFSPSLKEALKKTGIDSPKAVYTLRERYNSEGILDELVPTPFAEWESQGTKKLFALATPLLIALMLGHPMVIDEFDARFHPLLTEKIVSLFNQQETNPRNAQLIFVTHDASLLSRAKLRRDQICLVEKDQYGISTARTLIEFKGVRKDALYEKEYLQGVYGSVPFLGDMDAVVSNLVNNAVSTTE